MVKIKRKVEKNLPQLIEWAMDNDVTDRIFSTKNAYCVGFDRHGFIYFNSSRTMPLYQTFTVEVEEEITEDMKLDFLLDHFINPYGQHYVGDIHHNRSINDVLEENDEMEIATNSIHLFDKETKEFKLIWRDGKLVE